MKTLLMILILSTNSFAQDLSNPELDYYQESTINEEEYSKEEFENIKQSEEESYPEDLDEQKWREENAIELQEMEEDYVE